MEQNAATRDARGGRVRGAGEVRTRIMACAVREFASKGFAKASLRSIAAAANVTTGAIYGYFTGKEALFDAIVSPAGEELYQRYVSMQEGFYRLPLEAQTFDRMEDYETGMVHRILDYVYDNREVFALILFRSAGTSWERYLDRFIDLEVESTFRYAREMRGHGVAVNDLDPAMARALAGMFYRGYFEPLALGMDRDEAHVFVSDLERFFRTGYIELMEGGEGATPVE